MKFVGKTFGKRSGELMEWVRFCNKTKGEANREAGEATQMVGRTNVGDPATNVAFKFVPRTTACDTEVGPTKTREEA